jgi:hypothetical protein
MSLEKSAQNGASICRRTAQAGAFVFCDRFPWCKTLPDYRTQCGSWISNPTTNLKMRPFPEFTLNTRMPVHQFQ